MQTQEAHILKNILERNKEGKSKEYLRHTGIKYPIFITPKALHERYFTSTNSVIRQLRAGFSSYVSDRYSIDTRKTISRPFKVIDSVVYFIYLWFI